MITTTTSSLFISSLMALRNRAVGNDAKTQASGGKLRQSPQAPRAIFTIFALFAAALRGNIGRPRSSTTHATFA
jgi:hypothetical protein